MCEDKEHPYEHLKFATITLENHSMRDGDLWNLEIIKTLREYADAVEKGAAGSKKIEILDSPRGTRLILIAGIRNGHKSPVDGELIRPVLK